MTTYRKIHGRSIQSVTTDPSESVTEGQIWYNSNSDTFKSVLVNEAWASASPLNTARSVLGGFGIQTSSVMYGGTTNSTEEYNGSGFSASGNLNTGRPNSQDNGWGVETAGVVASGYDGSNNTANVEEYNGSSFSEVTNLSTARRQLASIGLVQTAGAVCGGYTSTNVDSTEEYDGTNWTSGGSLNTSRRGFAGSGTLTAGIVFSGYTTTVVANTEEYDGTSWTTATSINTARNNGIGASNAPQSTAMLFGGNSGSDTGKTEQYNGTTWTEVADMATARDSLGGSGIGTAALAAGGAPPPGNVSIAEEFTQSANVITAGAWASGANANSNVYGRAGCGTTTAGLLFCGHPAPGQTTETYDGTSFTEVADLSTGRRYVAGFGTQTAAVAAGGNTPPGRTTVVEEWNGSSWGSNPNGIPTANMSIRGTGTSTAGLLFGGTLGPGDNQAATTQTFDGTSFSEVSDLNTGRAALGGAGTQTASLAYGGFSGAPPITTHTNTESWDGSSWTNSPTPLNTATQQNAAAGTSTSALSYAGNNTATSNQLNTFELYNGTTWITQPNMAIARSYIAGFGVSTSALGAGGYGPAINPDRTRTEEFTAETSALNVKTLTQS